METICEIEGLEVRLNTTVTDADISPLLMKMKDYAAKNEIKGFRKGYVPISQLKKHFRESLMNDVSRLAIRDALNTIEKDNMEILLNPVIDPRSIEKMDWFNSTSYKVCFLAGQPPEIKIDFGDREFTKASVVVLKKTVDMYIKNILENLGKDKIDTALFDQLYTKGTVKDEKEFRKRLKADIISNLQTESRNRLRSEIREYLLEINKFLLPSRFLTTYYFSNYQETEPEYFKMFMDNVRWDLIEDKLLKDAKIKVEEKDVREKVVDNLKRRGVNNSKEIVDGLMSNQNEVSRVKKEMERGLILDYLISKMNVKEKKVSYKDFKGE